MALQSPSTVTSSTLTRLVLPHESRVHWSKKTYRWCFQSTYYIRWYQNASPRVQGSLKRFASCHGSHSAGACIFHFSYILSGLVSGGCVSATVRCRKPPNQLIVIGFFASHLLAYDLWQPSKGTVLHSWMVSKFDFDTNKMRS